MVAYAISILVYHTCSRLPLRVHTTMIGPQLPTTMLQKMAGFAREAQWMYWKGVVQNDTGAMAIDRESMAREKR